MILFCQINWSFAQDKMFISLNNLTNGRFGNHQIYWCIVGYDKENQLVYVDRNGNLIRANTNMNTINKDVKIGVSAGASTPKYLIEEILNNVRNEF